MKKVISVLLAVLVLLTLVSCNTEEQQPLYTDMARTLSIKGADYGTQGLDSFAIGTVKTRQGGNVTINYCFFIELGEGYVFRMVKASDLIVVKTDSTEPSIRGYFTTDNGFGEIHGYPSTLYIPTDTLFIEI